MTVWIDFILAAMLGEAVALTLYHRTTSRGIAPSALLPNLLAGAMLLLSFRLALSAAAPLWVAATLLAALLSHLTDLTQRWPPKTTPSPARGRGPG